MSTYRFDITTNTVTFETTLTDSSFDLSEFDGDERGTARVADWSDIQSEITTESDYDTFLSTLNLTINSSSLWIGASGVDTSTLQRFDTDTSPNPPTRYYYVADHINQVEGNTTNRAFWMGPRTDQSGHEQETYSTFKRISLFSVLDTQEESTRIKKALVYFPTTGGNGGAIGDPHIRTFDGTRYTL